MEPRLWPRVLAVFATLWTVPSLVSTLMALGGRHRPRLEDAWDLIHDGGTVPFAIAVLVALALPIFAGLAGGRPARPATLLVLAALPWLAGSVTSVVAAFGIGAADVAEPAVRGLEVWSSLSAVMHGRLVGAACSAVLLSAVVASSAWNAFAPVGERQVLAGLGLGVAGGAMVIIVAAGAAIAAASMGSLETWPAVQVFLALAGLGWALVLGLPASATGPAREAVAPLVATAAAAAAVEALTAVPMAGLSTSREILEVLAEMSSFDDELLVGLIDRGLEEPLLVVLVVMLAALAMATAALGYAFWASRGVALARRALVAAVAVGAAVLVTDVASALVCRVLASGLPELGGGLGRLMVP